MSEQQILEIIFASGFSTAAKLTDVSGRGVGMDMVKSSVEAVGGQIDIHSQVGKGTTFTLRLPKPKSVLIINSLLIECANRLFAIPQDSILHILRIEKEKFETLLQNVASGVVLRYDNTIYPLVNLKEVLKIIDIKENESENIMRKSSDSISSVVEILILQTDTLLYALLVDGIHDSEEIVLKRLSPCFNFHGIYSGATFMGDGTIGLILDVKNVAEVSGIKSNAIASVSKSNRRIFSDDSLHKSENQDYLLFHLDSKAIFGIPLNEVYRLEEINEAKIQHSGAKKVILYRNCVMPIYSIEKLLNLPNKQVDPTQIKEHISIIVTKIFDNFIGLEVPQILDIASGSKELHTEACDRVGIIGNTFIEDKTVTILNLPKVLQNSKFIIN